MRVLCVVPPFYRLMGSHNNRLLLSLHSLAEVLAKRYDVEVAVLNLDSEPHEQYASWPEIYEQSRNFGAAVENSLIWDELRQKVAEWGPEVVIVAGGDLILPTVDFGAPLSMLKAGSVLREEGVFCYAYGVFPTLDPELFARDFDGVIVSEAEVQSVTDRLVKKHRGLILGELTQNLDEVPFLTYERLMIPVDKMNMDYVVSSRGCHWHCSFCIAPVVHRRSVRYMRVHRFVQEVEFRLNWYGVTAQYFADMNLVVPHNRCRAICEEILRRELKLRWWCEARSDSLRPELCELMKKAGCSHVKLGVEGNSKVMKALDKTETEEVANRAVEMARRAGLKVVCYTMLGAPGLSDADFCESYEFVKSLEADHYVVNVTVPWPGTPLGSLMQLEDAESAQHLNEKMIAGWGIRPSTVDKFMGLNKAGKKEDVGIRKYGKGDDV